MAWDLSAEVTLGLIDRLIQHGPAAEEPSPSWIEGTTRCLNAYIKRDTVLGLRRLGQAQQAEDLGRSLLLRGADEGRVGGVFALFLTLLDGGLDPERFLREQTFGGARVELTPELACQVHFYWGARLLGPRPVAAGQERGRWSPRTPRGPRRLLRWPAPRGATRRQPVERKGASRWPGPCKEHAA
jgi:hypothetical protein